MHDWGNLQHPITNSSHVPVNHTVYLIIEHQKDVYAYDHMTDLDNWATPSTDEDREMWLKTLEKASDYFDYFQGQE